MLDLLNVYRFQFKKREPILIGALSYIEALSILGKDKDLSPDDDEITSISIVDIKVYV